ncbi:hypothetical protein D3C78_1620140 [compost metagenome]
MGLDGQAAHVTAQAIVSGLAPVERRDRPALRRFAQVQRTHLLASLLDVAIDHTPITFRQPPEQYKQQLIVA